MSCTRRYSTRRECAHRRVRHSHGTLGAYNSDQCRCDDCYEAAARYRKWQRHMRGQGAPILLPVHGSARRLRALACMGWSTRDLADQLGIKQQYLVQIRRMAITRVHSTTAAKISAGYERLWNVTRSGIGATRARTTALRRGWLPPLAWDDIDDPSIEGFLYKGKKPMRGSMHTDSPCPIDEIAVERAMRGDNVPLTPSERSEAVARLTRMRYSAAEIAQLLGVTERTVVRQRSAA